MKQGRRMPIGVVWLVTIAVTWVATTAVLAASIGATEPDATDGSLANTAMGSAAFACVVAVVQIGLAVALRGRRAPVTESGELAAASRRAGGTALRGGRT